MDDKEVGKYWDENAENWTKLARMGYDQCRDLINSPAFFKILPDIAKLKGKNLPTFIDNNTGSEDSAKSQKITHFFI